jgi:hypothetical protein
LIVTTPLYHYIHPFASPFVCPGAAGGVIKMTAANNVNTSGKITGQEG